MYNEKEMRMNKMSALRIAGWLLSAVFLLLIYVKFMERFGIYYPMSDITRTPAEINLDYNDIMISTEDEERLQGWYIPSPGNDRVVLFFSGNAGNRGYRLDKLDIFHELNCSVLIVDYRGYGGSTGRASEKGLYEDGKAIWRYAFQELDYSPEHIYLYGESLGGAVAFHVAAEKEVAGIIVEGTFSSAREVSRDLIFFIPRFMVSNIYNNLQKASEIDAPLLILHSRDDEIIPFKHAKKLYEAAQEPKEFVTLEGSHNHAFLEDQTTYTEAIASFLERY